MGRAFKFELFQLKLDLIMISPQTYSKANLHYNKLQFQFKRKKIIFIAAPFQRYSTSH